MEIGSLHFKNNLVLAPMAGVTDRPFRQLCRELGAGLVVSEMVTSNPALWKSKKTQLRLNHEGEPEPIVVQIAGAIPEQMAEAAKFNVDNGAQMIDINMGCPAKKVCNVMAGSSLLRDEPLVQNILEAVVNAVEVPVTLKIRTGWDGHNKNALNIARIAEESGIKALTVHGRTRACAFKGEAEHQTVAEIKSQINIPVIANGDITTPQRAKEILDSTKVDGIMIGRAAQGNPWIFREIEYYLTTGKELSAPNDAEVTDVIQRHLENLYDFYGEFMGLRIARKHIAWYCKKDPQHKAFCRHINKIENANRQYEEVISYFEKGGKLAA